MGEQDSSRITDPAMEVDRATVVSAVKSGASELILSDIAFFLYSKVSRFTAP
jgi:hypothetical protein